MNIGQIHRDNLSLTGWGLAPKVSHNAPHLGLGAAFCSFMAFGYINLTYYISPKLST